MASPDLSTARPSSTRPVRPSSVLCTRSPTPATVLVAACHAAPATCTPWDKQTWFSIWNKGKRKTKQNYPGFEFKPRQVNDSSQSNQGTDHLVSHLCWDWITWDQVGPLGGKRRTIGWEGQGVICGKLAPLRLYVTEPPQKGLRL
jgi:hypothetical protein